MRNQVVAISAVLIGLALLWASSLLDPINRLQLKLTRGPIWESGYWDSVKLGPGASVADVLKVAWEDTFTTKDRQTGRVLPIRILETKTIHTLQPPTAWTAVLFDSDRGRMILLTRYSNGPADWSARFER
jgi:hypothetical protein